MTFDTIGLDFETVDPYLLTWGPGYFNGTGKIVGCGIQDVNEKTGIWSVNEREICDYANATSTIICHNAMYDCGYLMSIGVDLKNKTIIDTKLLAMMHCNLDMLPPINNSLSGLSKKYLKTYKTQDELGKAVIKHKLYKTSTGKQQNCQLGKAIEYAYKHMDELYKVAPEIVADYCLQDVNCTLQLYQLFKNEADERWIKVMSNCIKQFLLMKRNGVFINLDKIKSIRKELMEKELEYLGLMSKMLKMTITDKDLADKEKKIMYLEKLGCKLPTTKPSKLYPYGQKSVTSPWLEKQDNEFCKLLVDYTRYGTYRNMYCDTILEYAILFPNDLNGNILNMHPDYKPFGAFTCRSTSSHPNIQQIPGADKDPIFGYKIRDAYIHPKGMVAEADYRQQEFRLFADLTNKLKLPRLVDMYKKNPLIDFHELVAKIIWPEASDQEIKEIRRPAGKKINFGKLYGKGVPSICKELGMPKQEGEKFVKFYDTEFPEVKKTTDALKYIGMKRGYIKVDNRKIYVEKPRYHEGKMMEFYYRLLNYYCQGRGANQIYFVMSNLYEEGITPYYEVHDSLGFGIRSVEEDMEELKKIKYIMENSIDSDVEMLIDLGIGNSWAQAKSKEGKFNV